MAARAFASAMVDRHLRHRRARATHRSCRLCQAALGASSFARALYAFGLAVRLCGSSALPFAVAREPAFVGAHRLGFVFGALAIDPEWQMRALAVGRRTALAQSRVLALTALLDVRLHAARLLLGDPATLAPRDLFDELGVRLFGASLDGALARSMASRVRDDEPGRFIALLQARRASEALRSRFDLDWFRNPRAWAELRAQSVAPARESLEPSGLDGEAVALARAFEAVLG